MVSGRGWHMACNACVCSVQVVWCARGACRACGCGTRLTGGEWPDGGPKRGGKAGVCLKGRALWGPTQSSYKAVGAHCKIGWGGSHWRLEKRGGGIGVVDVPSGRVVGGALGGEGGAPLPSSKALGQGALFGRTVACARVSGLQTATNYARTLTRTCASVGTKSTVGGIGAQPDTAQHCLLGRMH